MRHLTRMIPNPNDSNDYRLEPVACPVSPESNIRIRTGNLLLLLYISYLVRCYFLRSPRVTISLKSFQTPSSGCSFRSLCFQLPQFPVLYSSFISFPSIPLIGLLAAGCESREHHGREAKLSPCSLRRERNLVIR